MRSTTVPAISVIMAVYNGERYLAQAAESILRQSFPDFEFIIINDASSDRTADILKKYEEQDRRVRVLGNATNMGLTKSLNKGIRVARGEYIARMDADDISHPDRIKLQAAFLDAHAVYGAVGSWYSKIDEHGQVLGQGRPPTGDEELRAQLIGHNPLPHASLMIRRQALERVGLYEEAWRFSQDYELLFRISSQYKLCAVPEFLLSLRISRFSVTGIHNRAQVLYAVRARRDAIQRGQYPKTAYRFLILPLLALVIPMFLRRFLKRFLV